MTAGVLQKLGINMGEDLKEKRPPNPLGYYENVEFIDLNNKILKEAGGDWRNPPAEEKILKQQEKFEDDIKKLIKRHKDESWGWKDPRNSLTIKLYTPYIDNPYFIVCHRKEQAIARSLYDREGINRDKSIRLKKIYEDRINKFFKENDYSRLDIYYEDVLDQSRKNLERIIDFLKLNPQKRQKKEAENFIMPKKEIKKLSFKLRIKNWVKKATKNPHKLPLYVFNKLKLLYKEIFKRGDR